MDALDLFFKKYNYKFPKGYPDMSNPSDVKLLNEILASLGVTLPNKEIIKEEASKFGYKIGEFNDPSETLASRNFNFNSRVGYLGTGYYFYGDEETAKSDKSFLNRKEEIKQIDLSKYKLYRAPNPEIFYDEMKNITRELGLYASSGEKANEKEYNDALDEIYDILKNELNLPLNKEKTSEIITKFIEDIRTKTDGPLLSNRILQPLGYEGIDNTGTNLDNYGVGSVIFS
jgi:hypothetical protein